ncbi:hypothetical protein EJB05_29225, partial [Eragrostis curvula]
VPNLPLMAMALDALASYVQSMLMEMATDEVRMLLGVPNEMNKMGVKLGDLKKFLADADRRNITDELVHGWVKELKGAMYDATDILDLCQLKAMKRRPSRDMGCLNPLLFCMRNPLHAHDIGSRLRNLNEKLDDIIKRSKTFNFNLTSYEDHGRKKESSRHLPSRETTGEPELDVIGEKIKEDTRDLVEMLTRKEETIHEDNKVMVFAIVGVGGIGKSTLAKNIFNNEIIQQEFQKKIWVSVNQDYSDTELLRRTIEAGGGNQAAGNTMEVLKKTLKETLKGCKTLLVMDDVWNHRAWENVLKIPLTNVVAQGSRVLVTTRNHRIARGMMAEEPYHNIDKLKPEDAWSLLKEQVVRNVNDESQVEMLKDIGMGIIAKCDGLPLAVKVMGGVLLQKNRRRSDWEAVLRDSVWSISQMPEELNSAIYLSYQDLESPLKPCFLYVSLLPKSKCFSVHEIVGMWISEGIIHGNLDDLENIGREYYDELILRKLIEPNMRYVDQQACNMHDVVRSFAQYIARDEALVAGQSSKIDITSKLNLENFIMLSLENKGSESDELEWMSLQEQISVRTLISIGNNIKIKPSDSLVTFPNLRTLYVQNADFDQLVESLVKLKYLRYLSIPCTNISKLPENIHKMKFLQYISLLHCESLVKLPVSIGKLQDLRYLDLCWTSINSIPRGFGGLTSLRKLYGFPVHMDGDWCSLVELGPLSKLIELYIHGLENVSSSIVAKKTDLCGKVHLRKLGLCCTCKHGHNDQLFKEEDYISGEGHQNIEEVFDELCPPPSVENLTINTYFGRRLPIWMTSNDVVPLGSLRIIVLEELPCCTELPNSLCQLPCLEFLQIKRAPAIKRVGPEFLQLHHHEQLRELEVSQCPGIERIGNLPKLQELLIDHCPKLKVLEGVPALERLVLEDYDMSTLSGYLQNVNPRHLLKIYCDVSLLTSIAIGTSSPEWDKFSHIKEVKAYADVDDNNIDRKWYVSYTRDPFSFETNISRSAIKQACRERTELAYSKTCPIEDERPVGRGACADKCRPLCQRFRCNAYRHLSHWLNRVCLHCSESAGIADSSDQWTEAARQRENLVKGPLLAAGCGDGLGRPLGALALPVQTGGVGRVEEHEEDASSRARVGDRRSPHLDTSSTSGFRCLLGVFGFELGLELDAVLPAVPATTTVPEAAAAAALAAFRALLSSSIKLRDARIACGTRSWHARAYTTLTASAAASRTSTGNQS